MNSFYLSLNLGSFLFQYISYILRDEIFSLTQSFKFHDKAFLTSRISNQTAGEVVVMVFFLNLWNFEFVTDVLRKQFRNFFVCKYRDDSLFSSHNKSLFW